MVIILYCVYIILILYICLFLYTSACNLTAFGLATVSCDVSLNLGTAFLRRGYGFARTSIDTYCCLCARIMVLGKWAFPRVLQFSFNLYIKESDFPLNLLIDCEGS